MWRQTEKCSMSDNNLSAFYVQIYNLAYIQRYNTMPRIKNESVAEHSFFVASIVVKLYETYDFNLGKALLMAVTHDWAESWLGDIVNVVKNGYPYVGVAIQEAEYYIMGENFYGIVYENWHEHNELISVEAKIVKYADVLQVLQYANHEVSLGNTCFKRVIDDVQPVLNNLKTSLEKFVKTGW